MCVTFTLYFYSYLLRPNAGKNYQMLQQMLHSIFIEFGLPGKWIFNKWEKNEKESWTWKTVEVGQEMDNIKLIYFLMCYANKSCRKTENLNYKSL